MYIRPIVRDKLIYIGNGELQEIAVQHVKNASDKYISPINTVCLVASLDHYKKTTVLFTFYDLKEYLEQNPCHNQMFADNIINDEQVKMKFLLLMLDNIATAIQTKKHVIDMVQIMKDTVQIMKDTFK